jgi:hypothetical protein
LTDAAKLVASMGSGIPMILKDKEIKEVLGDGLVFKEIDGEATAAIGWSNLLNVDTFLAAYDVT